MALKLIALFLLWFLFFSPAHRSPVNGETTGRRFAVDPMGQAAGDVSVQKEKTR
jgi:hypothetical protein